MKNELLKNTVNNDLVKNVNAIDTIKLFNETYYDTKINEIKIKIPLDY